MLKSKRLALRLAMAALAAMMVLTGVSAWAAETYVKKVDQFIFVVDRSGSMGNTYVATGNSKVASAKKLLGEFNTQIPELQYDSALTSAAPFAVLAKPATYNRTAYGRAIDLINTDVKFAGFLGNPTPLAQGLKDMEPWLKAQKGKTAVIVMSDGEANVGPTPAEVAGDLAAKYPVCYHVVSYAQTWEGQANLDKLAALNKNCSAAAKGSDLKDKNSQMAFLRKVLFDTTTVAAAPVDGDDDGDGVPNSKDKCPNTPKGVKVDKDGCPIKVSSKIRVLFDFDKSEIKAKYVPAVADFAKFIGQHADSTVTIEGHTDATGSPEYNQKLSQRRAQAVVDMLVKKYGVSASRLKAQGFGETKPIADNKTAAGRAENRRTIGVLDNVYEMK